MIVDMRGVVRHIRQNIHAVVAPVGHTPEPCRQVAQYSPCVRPVLNVHVAAVAWLHAASAIRDQLIAILRDAVQLPAIKLFRANALAEAKALAQDDIVENPGRVIGPGPFECARPGPAVGTGLRIIGIGYPDDPPLRAAHHLRNAIRELSGIKFNVQQRGVRVAKLGIDDLGNRLHFHRIDDVDARGVRRNTAHAQLPASGGLGQVYAMASLVESRRLVVHDTVNHRLICAAINRQIDGVFHTGTNLVAVILLPEQGRPAYADTYR